VLDGSLATVAEKKPTEVLASWSTNYGVTAWAAPALKFPTDTVVLVEGKHDCTVLKRAAELTGVGTGLIFCTPSQLDATLGDGWNSQREFVIRHAPQTAARLPMYPLRVLIDWDKSSGDYATVCVKYGAGADANVLRMDVGLADPRVGGSFKGIERFYSHRLLELARIAEILNVGATRSGGLVVDREDLERAKSGLAEFFVSNAAVEDCQHLLPVLRWAAG